MCVAHTVCRSLCESRVKSRPIVVDQIEKVCKHPIRNLEQLPNKF